MQEIKLHQPIIDTVIVCLKSIFEDNKVADKEVATHLKQNKNFGSRDRSLIAETVYDIVRWKLKYEFIVGKLELTSYKSLLLVSFLNRNYVIKNIEILGVDLNDIVRLTDILQQTIADKSIEQSYPINFYNFCEEKLGEKWYPLAVSLNNKPSVFIRVNSLQTSVTKFAALLETENISFKIMEDNCIEILSKNNLKNSELYRQGLFEFQDIGSQAIGHFLFDAIEDKTKLDKITVLDLCAGAGGKTLHLSALLNNKGKIYATDYKAARLKNLQQRAEQAGCKNIEIIEFSEAKKLKNIDFILIDAPCSGTGTFKRQADLKYKVTQEKIKEYQAIQASLLNEYKNVIHKNGKIIYATCSILPQENELQVQNFIDNNSSFKVNKSQQLLPTKYDGDGFYMVEIFNSTNI